MPDPKTPTDDRFGYDIGDLEVDNSGAEGDLIAPDETEKPPKDIHVYLPE